MVVIFNGNADGNGSQWFAFTSDGGGRCDVVASSMIGFVVEGREVSDGRFCGGGG